jgi:Spy/CpxP family protein refolding chaperone
MAQHVPYAGQQSRAIKALSAEETEQYLAGAGMGHARAAELNRYPGPMHVLELADRLSLSTQQRAATDQLMQTHKAEARAIGAKLVEAERTLDRIFAEATVTESALEAHVRTIADLQARYRLSHLETHRRMRELLTTEQVQRYVELRGYAGDGRNSRHIEGKHH